MTVWSVPEYGKRRPVRGDVIMDEAVLDTLDLGGDGLLVREDKSDYSSLLFRIFYIEGNGSTTRLRDINTTDKRYQNENPVYPVTVIASYWDYIDE